MSVIITGIDAIQKNLQRQMSEIALGRVQTSALKAGAAEVAVELSNELSKFKDTGATVDEITIGKVTTHHGFKHILVGWNGPKERYRIVHLNEFGYNRDGKKVKPRAYGAVRRSLENSKVAFYNAIEDELRKNL